jgi:small subunit ribosomal protein S6
MRRYELMLLLRPDLEDDKLQAAVEKVTRAIVNGGGSLSKVSPWGKRRLAYDIGTHREASYFLIHFDIEPSQVREIERGMLISEEILRHLVTVLEDRGPAEDLAPAAAPRTAEGSALASSQTDVADADTEDSDERVSEPEPEPVPEAAADSTQGEPTDEPAEETAAAVVGSEPTDEDRAAG